jgi:hypothetical protein
MKTILKSLTLAAGLIAGATSASAQSQNVLTFDDLLADSVGTHMADGYGGFNWNTSDWYYMAPAAAPINTYLALSGTATAVISSGGTDFYFNGADFWSRRGLDANGVFYFILFRDGVVVYDGRNDRIGRQIFTGSPTTFVANYSGPVDAVAVAFTQGGKDWNHLAMDNFRYTTIPAVVPPPAPTPVPTPTPTPTPIPTPTPAVTTYKLTVKTVGKGSVTVSRTGNTFVAGQVITLTANPAVGTAFKGWSGDAAGTAQTIAITMTKAMTITASFK